MNGFGIPYLFLDPEYVDKVGFWSFFIMGVSCGLFISATNISSYIIIGRNFPFLATLSRPFIKYNLNNSIIPMAFISLYVFEFVQFQINEELRTNMEVIIQCLGFLSGLGLLNLIAYSYFSATNTNAEKIYKKITKPGDKVKEGINKTIKVILRQDMNWKKLDPNEKITNKWRVEYYLFNLYKIRRSRIIKKYNHKMLMSVFKQNHINAVIYSLLITTMILVLRLFRDYEYINIPAGASILLLLSISLMLFSAIHSVFKAWSFLLLVGLFALFNFISSFNLFEYENSVYGLRYDKNIEYNNEYFSSYIKEHEYKQDLENTIQYLENWKEKVTTNDKKKPKIIFINASGGGLRSALWTFYSMAYIDGLSNGKLMDHTAMLTGSSGGMLGCSYLRELYYQKNIGEISTFYVDSFSVNLAKDLINPVTFNLVVNDLLLPFEKVRDSIYVYPKNRSYAIERQLNENINYILDKKLGEYTEPVFQAKMPLMIITPTIVNDGRRLIISSQPLSYLTKSVPSNYRNSIDDMHSSLEYMKLFRDNTPENMKLTTALRLTSTFIHVTPMSTLPTNPRIDMMDSGIRDNYGIKTTINFTHHLKDWLEENTSGVIFIQTRYVGERANYENQTIFQQLFNPLGKVYDNMFNIQNYDNEDMLSYLEKVYDGDIEVVNFVLGKNNGEDISLSWHLTQKEKRFIKNSIHNEQNKKATNRLIELLEE